MSMIDALLRPRAVFRVRDPIAARIVGALVGLLALFAAMGWMAFWWSGQTTREIARVEQSLNKLEIARAIEAAFNRYLLREIGRRVEGDLSITESPEAARLRGVLLTYRRVTEATLVGAGQVEFEAARDHLLRARLLASLFDAIETESMLDRRARAADEGATAAREFLTRIAGERDGAFRDQLSQVVSLERRRAESAYARLDALRAGLASRGAALAVCAIAVAAVAGVLFHRGLVRPIRALADAASAFGSGARDARAPRGLPGEFDAFAGAFNAMADRLAGEQHRLEAEVAARTAALEAANAELTRVDATRRRFFANVSHELRTPVTVLLGEARVALRGGGDPAPLREALERIAGSGGYLRRRLDDLLSLARSDDGGLTLTLGVAEMNRVLSGAVDAARAYAAANEIALVLVPAAVEVAVRGDGEALRQAALALIDNAVKFCEPGAEVEVHVTADPPGFRVADRGPGFAAADVEALFGRYAQEEDGRRAGGAGLGLSIVRWIADQHGGAVTAANRDGGGAVIAMTLKPASIGAAA